MYVRPSHRPQSQADVTTAMAENMFATLVSCSASMIASHLPFVFEPDENAGTLFAHMARANPHAAVLERGEECLVIFQGPHGYISPSWYDDRETAPTWDYVAVHCYGRPRIHSAQEAEQNIERLIRVVERHQRNPWSIAELQRDDVDAMIANIVSFEIPLTRVEGKFKLNQGEKPERTRAAIAQLESSGATALAGLIRRYNAL